MFSFSIVSPFVLTMLTFYFRHCVSLRGSGTMSSVSVIDYTKRVN